MGIKRDKVWVRIHFFSENAVRTSLHLPSLCLEVDVATPMGKIAGYSQLRGRGCTSRSTTSPQTRGGGQLGDIILSS